MGTGKLRRVKYCWKMDNGPLRNEYDVFLDLLMRPPDAPGHLRVVDPEARLHEGQKLYIQGIGDVTVTDVGETGESCNFEYAIDKPPQGLLTPRDPETIRDPKRLLSQR